MLEADGGAEARELKFKLTEIDFQPIWTSTWSRGNNAIAPRVRLDRLRTHSLVLRVLLAAFIMELPPLFPASAP